MTNNDFSQHQRICVENTLSSHAPKTQMKKTVISVFYRGRNRHDSFCRDLQDIHILSNKFQTTFRSFFYKICISSLIFSSFINTFF